MATNPAAFDPLPVGTSRLHPLRTDESIYFTSGNHQLAGWLHRPAGRSKPGIGLVICKPFGYESLCGHRSIRAFAHMAAELGMPVLRFDYLGTGDSQDIDPMANQIETWVGDVQAAIVQLRALTGVSRVCLMGIRLGAMLAGLAIAQGAAASELLLVAPVVSGRRYLRELRTTRLVAAAGVESVPESAPTPPTVRLSEEEAPGANEFSGYDMSAATMAALSRLELVGALLPGLGQALIVDRSDFPVAEKLRQQLAAAGTAVEYAQLSGFVEMSLVAPHEAMPPQQMLAAARQWLSRLAGGPPEHAVPQPSIVPLITAYGRATLRVDPAPGVLTPSERAVNVGTKTPLFGILTEPRPREMRRRGVILLNVGADYHIGPSRMYVSLARRWARHGYHVLRMDLAGIGDSPALPGCEDNVVYAPAAVDHVAAAVEFMRCRYRIQDLTLAGVCAGAYHGLRAAAAGVNIERLLMVNPQTFFWKEGSRIRGLTSAEVVRNPRLYLRHLASFDAWQRLCCGEVNLWRIFQTLVRRPYMSLQSMTREGRRALGIPFAEDLGRDLKTIAARGVRVVFAFSPEEVGLTLLRLQAGSVLKKLGNKCRIHQLPSGDHTFSQHEPRRILEEALSEELFARLDSMDAPAGRPA